MVLLTISVYLNKSNTRTCMILIIIIYMIIILKIKKKKKSTIETNKRVDIFLLQVITMSPP